MNIKPLFDNIVIEEADKKETTSSGFYIPSANAEKYVTAKVKTVGLGGIIYGKEIAMFVKAGDTVLYPAGVETKTKINGEDVTFIKQSDVIAIVG